MQAASKIEVFDFLNDASEDIYTANDGMPNLERFEQLLAKVPDVEPAESDRLN